jgi:hypothetical protein
MMSLILGFDTVALSHLFFFKPYMVAAGREEGCLLLLLDAVHLDFPSLDQPALEMESRGSRIRSCPSLQQPLP